MHADVLAQERDEHQQACDWHWCPSVIPEGFTRMLIQPRPIGGNFYFLGALVRFDIKLDRCYECWPSLDVYFRSVCTGTHYLCPLTVIAHLYADRWPNCIETWNMFSSRTFLQWTSLSKTLLNPLFVLILKNFSPFSPEQLVEMASNLLLFGNP